MTQGRIDRIWLRNLTSTHTLVQWFLGSNFALILSCLVRFKFPVRFLKTTEVCTDIHV